jgi:hypothetical protein
VQPEAVKDVGVRTQGDPGLAALHRAQRRARHAGSLGDERHGKPTPQPHETTQTVSAVATHWSSQPMLQQNASAVHTQDWQNGSGC